MDAKRFEVFVEDVRQDDTDALVRVDYGAICKADIRYYLGNRSSRLLGLKYPLSLIHEATGTVLKAGAGNFVKGEHVVFVPNISRCKESCPERHAGCRCLREDMGENYCPNACFASSNYDGFSKEVVAYPPGNLVRLHTDKPAYVFCELISVAIAALRRVSLNKASCVAVFGDGVMGYILCSVIKEIYGCGVYAYGKHPERLERFSMCDGAFIADGSGRKLPRFDTAFECVGGTAAAGAINSAIDFLAPGGEMVLMGVSEQSAALNTRRILEKGLTLKGTTRSVASDFERAAKLLDSSVFQRRIEELIIDYIRIKCIDDYYLAFEKEIKNKRLGKYILVY